MKKENASEINKLFISILFFWLALYIHIPYQVVYLNRFTITGSFLGLIVGAYGYMQAICRIPLSLLGEKINSPKLLIMIGAFLPAIASFIRLQTDSPIGFFIANLIGGLAASFWILYIVEFSRKMEKVYPERKNAAAVINMANQFGILMGYILGAFLYQENRLQSILIVSIFFSLCSVFILLIMKNEANVNTNSSRMELSNSETMKTIIKNKQMVKVFPVGFIHFGILTATVQSISVKKVAEFYSSRFHLGFINIAYMTATVLFSFLLTYLMKNQTKRLRLGDKQMLVFGFLLESIYLISFAFATNIVFFSILQIIAGLFSAIIATYGIKLSLQYVPAYLKNVGMGFYQTFVALGMSIIPILVGAIIEIKSFRAAYLSMAILTGVMTIYSAIFIKDNLKQ